MQVNFEWSVLAFWYDSWLVLAGYAAALVLTILTLVSSKWNGPGLLLNIAMILAVLAGLPLTMVRVGLDLAVSNYDAIGYINILGSSVAVVVGLAYLQRHVIGVRLRQAMGVNQPLEGWAAESITPTQGLSGQTEMGEPGQLSATLMEGATPAPERSMLTQAPTAWLHFKSGPMTGHTMPLESGVTSLGRAEDNDVVIEDAAVSRHHAQIKYQNGQYFIEDENSASGTLVEGASATRTLLASGATLQVGETEIMFLQAGSASPNGTASGSGFNLQSPAETIVMDQPQFAMAWLAVTAGPQKGKTYQLKIGDNTIGREGCDLVIEDAAVSRRHAMIKVQGDNFLLIDTGSRGGTRVGGKSLGGKIVNPGSVISLGQTRLTFMEVEGAKPSEQPMSLSSETIIQQPDSASGGVLIVQSGPDAGRSFTLAQGDNLIGRDPDTAVSLTDETVSRKHALLRRDRGRSVIFDLGSRTGTQVDGKPMGGYRLSPGDSISLGGTELVLMYRNPGKDSE